MKFHRFALLGVVLALFAVGCSKGNVFEVEVGDCFDDPGATEVSDLPMKECSDPHDNEVFALYEVTGDTLPAQQDLLEGCFDRFEAAIGTAYADSIYDFGGFTPSSEGFDNGDKEVICYAFTFTGDPNVEGEKLVGSILGSGK